MFDISGPKDGWAHLCVDMQRMFLEGTPWHVPHMAAIVPAVEAMAGRHAERTVFTRFVPAPAEQVSGAWRAYYDAWPDMRRERLPPELLNLVPSLARHQPEAHTLDKPVFSPWWSGDLHRFLRGRGVETLVVTGGETEVCVAATVFGAIDLGYQVVLPSDALCSSADDCHDAMLAVYRSRFGVHLATTTTQDLLDNWR